VTSYSALSRFHTAPTLEDKQTKKIAEKSVQPLEQSVSELVLPSVDSDVNEITIFSFPRGAKHGTFLHELFEEIDFQDSPKEKLHDWLIERLTINHYEPVAAWANVLSQWISFILDHALAPTTYPDLRLSELTPKQKKVEMQFFIPMALIDADSVNQLIAHYDPLSARAGALQFNQVQGMLKGFIDLTFEYQGQYFVLDYKSNYLGDNLQDYSEQAMADAIVEHRYDFQYQLYTLALHRLLKSRLVDYDYHQHIGGVFYTFLRGMQGTSNAGCYFTKPAFELIDKLDRLLSGELDAQQSQEELLC
jgi:exodeoxyribonuclease V beta subunit